MASELYVDAGRAGDSAESQDRLGHVHVDLLLSPESVRNSDGACVWEGSTLLSLSLSFSPHSESPMNPHSESPECQ
jgi:hypothetical protein